MTPLELGILIHYRGSAVDYRFGDFSAPAVRQKTGETVFRREDIVSFTVETHTKRSHSMK